MEREKLYLHILDNMQDGVYFVDRDRRITFWNKGAERISGFSADDVLGTYCHDNTLNHVDENGRGLCLGGCPLHKTIQDAESREGVVYLQHKLGHRVPVFIKIVPIMDDDAEIAGAVEIFYDMTEKRSLLRNLEEYKFLAMTDQLTGLPNRRYIDTFVISRHSEYIGLGLPYAVAMMDVDHFKRFNDAHGHPAGDQVLIALSNTCRTVTRATDLFGRWGGEEFIFVFFGINAEILARLTEKIRMLVQNTRLLYQGKTLEVTVSIGASIIRPPDTADDLIERTDSLMYESKRSGRNRVTIG